MGYKLELDLPNAGKGVEVYLDGLGIFENPGTYDISDEQASAFQVAHQVVTYHHDEETGAVTHTTAESGPTVEEYYKDNDGVIVTAAPGPKTAKASTKAPVDAEANKTGDASSKEEGGS